MSVRKLIECDRCHKDAGSNPRRVEGQDLCKECSSAFDAFMKKDTGRGSGVPPGFKRVQRPCPHHVPCADPQGCSGSEIVRI